MFSVISQYSTNLYTHSKFHKNWVKLQITF